MQMALVESSHCGMVKNGVLAGRPMVKAEELVWGTNLGKNTLSWVVGIQCLLVHQTLVGAQLDSLLKIGLVLVELAVDARNELVHVVEIALVSVSVLEDLLLVVDVLDLRALDLLEVDVVVET